jgi:hypothetical protein
MDDKLRMQIIKLASYGYGLFSSLDGVEGNKNIDKEEFNRYFAEITDIVENFTVENLKDSNNSEEMVKNLGGLYLAFVITRNIIKKGEMN